MQIQPLDPNKYFSVLAGVIDQSDDRDAFIFIHGFNETFEKTALRTAQLAHDLGFKGAPLFYSWPSQGDIGGYLADGEQIDKAAENLSILIARIVEDTKCRKLHLIAHSMGSRALSTALKILQKDDKYETIKKIVNQVIFTAADVDAEIFEQDIAPKILGSSGRITLYVSKKDKALVTSRKFHSGKPRIGEKIVVIQGIDTIDASAVKTDALGHGYFSKTKALLEDIHQLFQFNYTPEQRDLDRRRNEQDLLPYWAFK